jgi:hypothetical protein
MGGKSGVQIGLEHLERVRQYIADLRARNRAFPSRAGKPNLSAIALVCGFDRGVFYNNSAAMDLVEAELGPGGIGLESSDMRAEGLPGSSDPRDQRIMRLEQANASLRAEIDDLRARVKRLSHIEAHMVETGRRVAR